MLHRLCRRVAAKGRVAVQDGVELFDQPAKSRLSARKDFECLRPLGEIMAFKQSPSDNSLVALEQRQRHQEVLCGDRLVTFGKPLEKDERPVWPLIQKRRRCGECQEDPVAGTRLDRRFGQRQEAGISVGIAESGGEPLDPCVGRAWQIERKRRLGGCGHEAIGSSDRIAESAPIRRRLAVRAAGSRYGCLLWPSGD